MSPAAAPAGWRIRHLELRIELAADRIVVTSRAQAERDDVGDGDADEPIVLDGRALETLEVSLDGEVLGADAYELAARTLTVPTGGRDRVALGTVVAITPGAAGDKGFCLRDGVLHTNLEPQGFRRITWSFDRPDQRATYDVTLVADPTEFPVLLCNGDAVGEGTLDDGRRWARFVDPIPKPTYLFAVVAGELATVSRRHVTPGGREVELRVVATPEAIDGAGFALGMMAEVLDYDHSIDGVEHDLDVLTFAAVPGYPDATEYHGLMFFEPGLLVADHRGHVDDDLMLVLLNVAHEYGHHTRGNRFTVRTWGQLTLKEGLTVLMGQNGFREHWMGPSARVLDVLDLRRLQFPEEVTIGAPVMRGEVDDPAQLYTRTTYLKGAEIFRMIRTLIGDEAWRATFAGFVERFDLDSADVDDFVEAACAAAPDRADDVRAIARWFTQVGRPAVTVSQRADGSTVELDVRRTDALTDAPPLAMPIELSFRDADGSAVAVSADGGPASTRHTAVLRGRETTVRLQGDRAFAVTPLLGYSAPVDLTDTAPADELAARVVHDRDPFGRFWAAEELKIRLIDAHRAGDDAAAAAVLSVLAPALATVCETESDALLLANLLAPPDEFALGDREARIDVDGISTGLDRLRVDVGTAIHDPLLAAMARHRDDPDGATAADMSARWLVEPVLGYLLATGSADATALALDELRSPNATRAVRALGQLAHVDSVPLDDLLSETWRRWEHAPKLVDRWIRAQSGARRRDTIDRVQALAASPLYDREDRGRVMAVWFPFATRNRSVFHDRSGAGYRVFVDEVIELMPINAGLVVRLVGDLLQFRRFDEERQVLLRAELERMAGAPGMPDFAVAIVRGLLDG